MILLIWDAKAAADAGIIGVDGWPAADHEELDRDVARAKVSSGFYRTAKLLPKTPILED